MFLFYKACFGKYIVEKHLMPLNYYTLKANLKTAEGDLHVIMNTLSNQKYTKDGYPTSNFVSQWLDEVLKNEKASAELAVLERRRSELDQEYLHFSPIGSTIKRKERSIDFLERSYLSILSSLNTARLRLKSLEMNSASLKVLNEPTFPLLSKPTKRKAIVLGSYAASFIFVFGIFLLKELFDRRLLDKMRAEHITLGKVLGVFPEEGKLGKRIFRKSYEETCILLLGNNLLNYFASEKPSIINFFSISNEVQKTYIANALSDYWKSIGLSVKNIDWNKDFSNSSKSHLLVNKLSDLNIDVVNNDVVIVEYPSIKENPIPKNLLQTANFNLVLLDAKKAWGESDQSIFDEITKLSKDVPIMILLTNVSHTVVENITGLRL